MVSCFEPHKDLMNIQSSQQIEKNCNNKNNRNNPHAQQQNGRYPAADQSSRSQEADEVDREDGYKQESDIFDAYFARVRESNSNMPPQKYKYHRSSHNVNNYHNNIINHYNNIQDSNNISNNDQRRQRKSRTKSGDRVLRRQENVDLDDDELDFSYPFNRASSGFEESSHEKSNNHINGEIIRRSSRMILKPGANVYTPTQPSTNNQIRRTSAPIQRVPLLQQNCDQSATPNYSKSKSRRTQSCKYKRSEGTCYKYDNRAMHGVRDMRTPPPPPLKQPKWKPNADQQNIYPPFINNNFNYNNKSTPDYLTKSLRFFADDPVEKKLQLVKLMQDLDCTVVRTFTTSSKGIVHRGDSFRRKSEATPDIVKSAMASASNLLCSASTIEYFLSGQSTPEVDRSADVNNTGYSSFLRNSKYNNSINNNIDNSVASKETKEHSTTTTGTRKNSKKQQHKQQQQQQQPQILNENLNVKWPQVCNVLVLGDQGVGKTTLLQQFFTSEFMGNADLVFDKEYEKTVSVEIDGQETTVTFVDLPSNSVKINSQQYSEIDAFIVCYSITDRQSFDFALSLLREFRHRTDTAVILVANKSDLVRSRKVTFEEGRSVCRKYNCKFIEVSAAFNHCVDDLLVGLVHQIRLNPSRQRAKSVPNTGYNMSTDALLSTKSSSSSSSSSHFSTSCFRGAKVFFAEFLFGFRKEKSRSCDNLWSL